MGQQHFEDVKVLLNDADVRFSIVEHDKGVLPSSVAHATGVVPHQVAKSVFVRDTAHHTFTLCVLPGDMKLNMRALAEHMKVRENEVVMAQADEVVELTACMPGTVPPFRFSPTYSVIIDESLLNDHLTIAFNAGLTTHTIVMNAADYKKVALLSEPTLFKFAELCSPSSPKPIPVSSAPEVDLPALSL